MKNKKTTKKPKMIKSKKLKVSKKKNIKIADNQIENLSQWLDYYKQNNKLPYNRIICSNCKMDFVSLKGIAISHAMKKFDNDMEKILTKSLCKSCKPVIEPPEKKERVVEVLTREEMQARRDAISETLPKFDFYKPRTIIDLTKDKDVCKEFTSFACHRPDIYLDMGCEECSLKKHCACPIKDITRKADGRGKKKRK